MCMCIIRWETGYALSATKLTPSFLPSFHPSFPLFLTSLLPYSLHEAERRVDGYKMLYLQQRPGARSTGAESIGTWYQVFNLPLSYCLLLTSYYLPLTTYHFLLTICHWSLTTEH